MEFHFSSTRMLITFFILFMVVLIRATTKTYKSKRSPLNLPPGPWKLPLVGNMHQLAISSLVHCILGNLAKTYGPLMHLQLGEISIAVVSSAEMATEIMKTHDTVFASRPCLLATDILFYNSTDIAFSPYGDYWKQLRKICTMELLSPQRVQTFRRIREEEVLNLITSISSDAARGGPFNLSRRIFSLASGIFARAAFGKKSRHQDDYVSAVAESSVAVAGFNIADMYPSVKCLQGVTGMRKKLGKLYKRLDEALQAILDEHKEREGESEEDLIDVLLRIQKHGELQFPLTDDNIKAVVNDLFSGGSDTSSTTVEWASEMLKNPQAMSEMLKNQQVMQRGQDEVRAVFGTKGNVDESGLHELNYLKMVIKETMRLHPPGALLQRESSKDYEINGYFIPAKTRIFVNAWAIGRDPVSWVQPDKFNPDRFLNSGIDFRGSSFNYIPFGAGRRMCPGIAFAIPNMELPLAQLLYHFDWKLPGGLWGEEIDMEEVFGLITRRKNDLCVTATPYHSSSFVI